MHAIFTIFTCIMSLTNVSKYDMLVACGIYQNHNIRVYVYHTYIYIYIYIHDMSSGTEKTHVIHWNTNQHLADFEVVYNRHQPTAIDNDLGWFAQQKMDMTIAVGTTGSNGTFPAGLSLMQL